MKVFTLLPLAALTTAIVLPDESVMSQVAIESHEATSSFFEDIKSKIPSKDDVLEFFEDEFSSIIDTSENALDEAFCDALDEATDGFQAAATTLDEEYFDVGNWFASGDSEIIGGHDDDERPPHHGRPGRGKKGKKGRKGGKGRKGRKGRKGGKHGKGGKRGHRHHRPHHGHKKSNKTVYELIAGSKYTTKLAELINDDDYLVDLLNGTTANFTVFVPTDKAFEKIPKHGKDKKPPKDIIRKILKHHISAEFYPAGRVLVTRTVPTLLEGEYLSHDPESTPQRLSTNIGFRGLTVNYYSRIVAVNIFGSNGVIHGVDSILVPPFKTSTAISFFPSEFSTLELGLVKTGLYTGLNDTSNHLGGTIFAPSNFAFQKLGPRINAFLFSKYGQKYLKSLLMYHVVANQTLYSDAFYKSGTTCAVEPESIPKGVFHVDLPTLLEDRSLSIDIGRYGRLIDIRINGFQSVAVPDGITKDGVLHVVSNVIIPPKKLGSGELSMYKGDELTVEDLKERLEPFVEADEETDETDETETEEATEWPDLGLDL